MNTGYFPFLDITKDQMKTKPILQTFINVKKYFCSVKSKSIDNKNKYK